MKQIFFPVFAIFFMCSSAIAGGTVTRGSGGSIMTELSQDIVMNKESSLEREWITIHQDTIPADLDGTIGVKTIYEHGYSSGKFKYYAEYNVKANQDLTAIEVRFLIFDIWGDLIRNLSATEVLDLKSGETRNFDSMWNVFSENEVSQFYASLAYVAQVRTKTGRVIKADPNIVVQEAQKFSEKFKASDLEPEPKRR